MILAAKSIDGVYNADPAKDPNAKKYETMSMADIVDKQLGVIDLAAAVLCMENKMPMCVFGLNEEDSNHQNSKWKNNRYYHYRRLGGKNGH